jgi:hypothetical protein
MPASDLRPCKSYRMRYLHHFVLGAKPCIESAWCQFHRQTISYVLRSVSGEQIARITDAQRLSTYNVIVQGLGPTTRSSVQENIDQDGCTAITGEPARVGRDKARLQTLSQPASLAHESDNF